MRALTIAFEEVTRSVTSLKNNPEELRRYLDMLEASIPELPYGDLLHEHACELAGAMMQGVSHE